jgi:uncharacterized membrane protein HdeD (DUF308 family)
LSSATPTHSTLPSSFRRNCQAAPGNAADTDSARLVAFDQHPHLGIDVDRAWVPVKRADEQLATIDSKGLGVQAFPLRGGTALAENFKQNAGLSIGLGVLVLVAGILALSTPAVAGLSVAALVGFLLIMGGAAQVVFAYQSNEGIWRYLAGILTVVAGGYLAFNAAVAATTLSIFLLIFLLATGIVEILLALRIRPIDGWLWTLVTGVLSVVLGIMIWQQFPLSGLVAVGVFLGIKLCFTGMTLIMLGTAARRIAKDSAG